MNNEQIENALGSKFKVDVARYNQRGAFHASPYWPEQKNKKGSGHHAARIVACARMHTYMHTHTHTCTRAHTHTHAHARTHTRTHTHTHKVK